MSVTILDVAKKAGVGVGTVSRVINSADHVKPATRQKIQDAMRELGFYPNAHARNLKRQTVSTVGFFFNSGERRLSDPFFNVLMAGMADACGDRTFDLLVASCRTPGDELKQLEALMVSNRVGGVVITDTRVNDPRIAMLQERDFPFVVFGRVGDNSDAAWVDVDGKRGVEDAVAHCFALGHKRVAFIGLPEELTCAQDRLAGYRSAFEHSGRKLDPRHIVTGIMTEDDGRRAAAQLLSLEPCPTAIVASSDVIAFGVMQAIHHNGLEVGNDIALIGFDDIPMAAHTNPPLSTVRQPIYNIGEQLVDMLVKRIHGETPPSRLVEPVLVMRRSTGTGAGGS